MSPSQRRGLLPVTAIVWPRIRQVSTAGRWTGAGTCWLGERPLPPCPRRQGFHHVRLETAPMDVRRRGKKTKFEGNVQRPLRDPVRKVLRAPLATALMVSLSSTCAVALRCASIPRRESTLDFGTAWAHPEAPFFQFGLTRSSVLSAPAPRNTLLLSYSRAPWPCAARPLLPPAPLARGARCASARTRVSPRRPYSASSMKNGSLNGADLGKQDSHTASRQRTWPRSLSQGHSSEGTTRPGHRCRHPV